MIETGVVRSYGVNHSARSGGIIGIFFSIFFNMKVEEAILISTHNTPVSICFLGTQKRVRNSHDGKRAISVRAAEILLYL